MTIPGEVEKILTPLLSGIHDALAGNLLGLYLRGSLATENFDPETSDIDILAATHRPVNEAEFALLADLHRRILALANPYANLIEIAYIEKGALRRYQPGVRQPTLYKGEPFARLEHEVNWIFERWTVRQYGIVLYGPEPNTLIDPISSHELREAARARLNDWAESMSDPQIPDWLLQPGEPNYVVETICRGLYTVDSGELSSKGLAVVWARDVLAEPWRSTVERSQSGNDDRLIDLAEFALEVRRFISWAAANPG